MRLYKINFLKHKIYKTHQQNGNIFNMKYIKQRAEVEQQVGFLPCTKANQIEYPALIFLPNQE